MWAFGIVYQRTVIRAILPRSWHVQLIATLATSIVLTNLAIIVFGTQPKEVPTRLSSSILDVGGCAWRGSGCSCCREPRHLRALNFFVARQARPGDARDVPEPRGLRGGRRGRRARGDRDLRALGRPRRRRRRSRLAPLQHLPRHGRALTIKAFAAVIAGGFGYVQGAILASFLIGITESLAGGLLLVRLQGRLRLRGS